MHTYLTEMLECPVCHGELTTTTLDHGAPWRVAASGAWTAEDTYVIVLCFYETPFCPTITCRSEGDRLVYDFKANVSFGPQERPQLAGWKEEIDASV